MFCDVFRCILMSFSLFFGASGARNPIHVPNSLPLASQTLRTPPPPPTTSPRLKILKIELGLYFYTNYFNSTPGYSTSTPPLHPLQKRKKKRNSLPYCFHFFIELNIKMYKQLLKQRFHLLRYIKALDHVLGIDVT